MDQKFSTVISIDREPDNRYRATDAETGETASGSSAAAAAMALVRKDPRYGIEIIDLSGNGLSVKRDRPRAEAVIFADKQGGRHGFRAKICGTAIASFDSDVEAAVFNLVFGNYAVFGLDIDLSAFSQEIRLEEPGEEGYALEIS